MPPIRLTLTLGNVFIVLATLFGVVLLWQLRALLVILAIAVVIAATLAPLVNGLERARLPRWLAVILVYLSAIVALVGLVLLVGPSVVEQVERLLRQLPVYVNTQLDAVEAWVLQLNDAQPELVERIFSEVNEILNPQAVVNWIVGSTQQILVRSYGITTGIVGGAINLFLAVLLSGYMVSGGRSLARGITQLFPSPWDDRLLGQVGAIGRRMGGYIQGRILVSAVLGAAVTAGIGFLGLPEYALGLGAIAGLTNLIPFFGPVLGSIPALIVALSQGGVTFLGVLILFVAIQNIETYVLDPLLVGSSVGVRPLYQLLAVLGGVQVMGIIGAIVAPPWVAGAALLLEELYLKPKLAAEGRAIAEGPETQLPLQAVGAKLRAAAQPSGDREESPEDPPGDRGSEAAGELAASRSGSEGEAEG